MAANCIPLGPTRENPSITSVMNCLTCFKVSAWLVMTVLLSSMRKIISANPGHVSFSRTKQFQNTSINFTYYIFVRQKFIIVTVCFCLVIVHCLLDNCPLLVVNSHILFTNSTFSFNFCLIIVHLMFGNSPLLLGSSPLSAL